MSTRHKELSEQLGAWWTTQTDFKTKKALASFLNVHPDTLGEYFSGKSFPRSDIANRLFELTNIECLRPDVGGDSSLHMVPQESPDAAASIEAPQESDNIAGLPGHPQEESHFGKTLEVRTGQPSGVALGKGGRQGKRSVLISLQRTSCPFCGHDIARFCSCAYCGQHFVWANVPLEDSKPLPTSNSWQERKAIVMPLLSPSLCYLVRTRKETGATLGIFKPKQIGGFIIEKEDLPDWTEEELAILSQGSFLDRKPFKILEKIPYKFIYAFTCNDPECKGHRLSITDWEVGQLYRRCKGQYERDWERYFRQKFETEMILGRNTHFYVGTLKAHPDRWIIVGLFYPPV